MPKAAQHVYTNVEADQSPTGRGGFQTLLATPEALSEDDIAAIEQRVAYAWPPGDSTPQRKRAAFSLGEERIALAHVTPLVGRDAIGRGGRSLAHTLVVSASDFAEMGGDAFAVFEAHQFFQTVDEALAASVGTGALPFAEVDAGRVAGGSSGMERSMGRLPSAARRVVALAALRSARLGDSAPALAFVGEPVAVESLVRASLLPLLPEERARFAFDTHFYRGRLAATPYAAVGLPSAPRGSRYVVVDTSALTTVSPPSLDDATPLERWADARLSPSDADLSAFAADLRAAREAAAYLEGKRDALKERRVAVEVVAAARQRLAERFASEAAASVPAAIARAFGEHIVTQRAPAEQLALLEGGVSQRKVLAALEVMYLKRIAEVDEATVSQLAQVFRGRPTERLAPWLALRLGEEEWLAEASSAQNAADYERLVVGAHEAGLAPKPLDLLAPTHTSSFIQAIQKLPEDHRPELRAVASALLRLDAAQHLDALAPYLGPQSPRTLRKLDAEARELPEGVAPAYRTRLADLVADLPDPSFKARLRRLIGLSG